MKHFQRLTAMLLTLAMALTMLAGMGPVAARAESQTDTAPEDARVEELANAKYDEIGVREDSIPKGFGMKASTEPALAYAVAAETGGVEINSTNFPDANFRNIISEEADADGDGTLSQTELENISSIDVLECSISDLKGIEYFTELTYLDCSANNLTNLDVSQNTKLLYLFCEKNALTSLDVSKNTALVYLYCYDNALTTLDVTMNTALVELYCYDNTLTSLDVSQNTELIVLSCYSNKLSALDVSKNTVLQQLFCDDNQLTNLDVSKNTALIHLTCHKNLISTVDVTKNTALISLYVYSNPLTDGVDVSKNTKLTELSCSNNNLTTLDVSKNTALVKLYCYENALTSLDLSKNTALEGLSCFGNQLTSLDLSANTALETLSASDNAYSIVIGSNNTFDLTTLPGSFDANKASGWTNGSVDGSTLTVTEIASPVTYTYDCGNGHTSTFTLNVTSIASVQRLAGDTRVETAIKVADAMKAELGVDQFSSIIVASGMNFADALAGSYLAAKKEAPILLYLDGNPANVEYIKNNLSSNGTVYILGGTSAVKQSFETDLTNAGIAANRIVRLAGATRFETNLLILEEAGISSNDEILVATAFNFADCLSASATGQPILMVNTDAKTAADMLTDEQRAFLKNHADNQVVIIGGTSAVSDAMQAEIEQYLDSPAIRLSGSGREATSVEVAKRYFPNPTFAVAAFSMGFPDGLCGGPLAYLMNAPLLLTRKDAESVVADYIKNMSITSGYILGGADRVSDDVVQNIFGITYPIPEA